MITEHLLLVELYMCAKGALKLRKFYLRNFGSAPGGHPSVHPFVHTTGQPM